MSYKVAVIDDMPYTREAIIRTIEWDKLGCIVVGGADNGISGKQLIIEKKPDIVITDIRMPGMDGLELTTFVKSFLPKTKVILITGYRDFEYAQKAVKLGVFDFILKPVDNGQLSSIVKSATARIDEEHKQETEHQRIIEENIRLDRQYAESLKTLKVNLLLELINGNIAVLDKLKPELAGKLELRTVRHRTAVIKQKGGSTSNKDDLINHLDTFLPDYSDNCDFEIVPLIVNKEAVLVFLFTLKKSSRNSKVIVKDVIEHMRKQYNKDKTGNLIFSVSSLYNSLSELSHSYAEALKLIDINFFKSEEEILFFDNSGKYHTLSKQNIIHDLERFYKELENFDEQQISYTVDMLAEKIADYSSGNKYIAKTLFCEICITLSRFFHKAMANESALPKNIDQILTDIDLIHDISGISRYIKAYIAGVKEKLNEKDTQYTPVVRDVIDYIYSNYSNDISLESISDIYSINPSYLSRLLKKETGSNFIDILTNARIEAAKRLLAKPQIKVYEIPEMVGYRDYEYFYRVFKKVMGISPTEYRKNEDIIL